MIKDIKYLVEHRYNKFDVSNYEDDDIISRDTLNDIFDIPKNKKELIILIKKRVRENKFGNKDFYFPDLSDIDVTNITDF